MQIPDSGSPAGASGPPTGRVTFLFTDIEGSTRLWEQRPQAMQRAIARHDALLHAVMAEHDGWVFKMIGDAFCVAFASPERAIAGAIDAQCALGSEPWGETGPIRARMALHTGEAHEIANDYLGPTVNRVARLRDVGHGGQVLVSAATLEAVSRELPVGTGFRDLGTHGLKDLQQPFRVYQLEHPRLAAEFPPLRSLDVLPNNLPLQLTSFIGRDRDIVAVRNRLGSTRLLTLTGTGGAGKTRLALQVAADMVGRSGLGAWMVELQHVRDPVGVPAALALALNIAIKPDAVLTRQVIDYLRPHRVLLVLDNFEQVAGAAPLVGELLRECPELTCLVTSRELLRIQGEHEYAVEPLSVPPPEEEAGEDWGRYDSVQLFLERCRAFRPDYALTPENGPAIAELCRRLDGVPLAIELAAARVRGMAPQQILQRIARRLDILVSTQRDLPARQRSIRGAIDWSFELLTPEEQALFTEAAIFAGGFSLEAAEEICRAPAVFEGLFSLRDRSLLRANDVDGVTRFHMLETVRDYALERLALPGAEADLRERFVGYYARQAPEWAGRLAGPDARAAMAAFRGDIANMRAAMEWALAAGRLAEAVTLGKALFPYLRRRGLYDECETRLHAAQGAADRAGDTPSVARLLNQRGLLAWDRGDLERATRLFSESYELSRRRDDRARMLVTGINLGNIAWGRSAFDEARTIWEECLALSIETGQETLEGTVRTSLGIVACHQERFDDAGAMFATALRIHERLGNQEGVAYTLYSASELHRRRQRYQEAIALLGQALSTFESLGHQLGIAEALVERGRNALELGTGEEAERDLHKGLAIACEIGDRRQQAYAHELLARLHVARGEEAEARRRFGEALDIAYEMADRRQAGTVLRYAGEWRWSRRDRIYGGRLLLRAASEYADLGLGETAQLEMLRAEVRAALGEKADSIEGFAIAASPDVLVQWATAPLAVEGAVEPGVGIR